MGSASPVAFGTVGQSDDPASEAAFFPMVAHKRTFMTELRLLAPTTHGRPKSTSVADSVGDAPTARRYRYRRPGGDGCPLAQGEGHAQ